MASLVSPRPALPSKRSFRPTSALAVAVTFTDEQMSVTLADGRVIGVPLAWFPTLLAATPEQRAAVEIGGGGVGLHWPELDEDLSVAGLLAGGPIAVAGERRLSVEDYQQTIRYRLPAKNVPAGLFRTGPGFTPIDVTAGPDGLTLRQVRWQDAPVVAHPDTGLPCRWLSVLADLSVELAAPAFLVCEVQRFLTTLDVEPVVLSSQAGQTRELLKIDSPETARIALSLLNILSDEQSVADAKAHIRAQLPDVVFP